MRVSVTSDDLQNGRRGSALVDHKGGPVEIALSRALGRPIQIDAIGGVHEPDVNPQEVYQPFGSVDKTGMYNAMHFNRGDPVEPFEFEFKPD